jgi:hypothetical protein
MKTMVCTMLFTDGQSVSASVSACSPEQESPVKYSGVIFRLGGPLCHTASVGFLEWYFQARAMQLQAQFSATSEGDFGPPLPVGYNERIAPSQRAQAVRDA